VREGVVVRHCKSTVSLSPELDDIVLASPYPEAVGEATHDECSETEGNQLNGCKVNTIEKVILGRLGWVGGEWEGSKEHLTT